MIFLRILEMFVANLFVSALSIYLFREFRTNIRHLDIPIFGFFWIYTTTLYVVYEVNPSSHSFWESLDFWNPIKLPIRPLRSLVNSIRRFVVGELIISLIGIIIFLILESKKRSVEQRSFRVQFPKIRIPKPLLGIILCVLAFLQLARILFHIWYIPPYVWDTVVYHLVNVAEWVQKQRIHAVISPVGRVYWPATFARLTNGETPYGSKFWRLGLLYFYTMISLCK